MQRAPAYGATLVNAHIGSHRGGGRERGDRAPGRECVGRAGRLARLACGWSWRTPPAAATPSAARSRSWPPSWRRSPATSAQRLAFCLDTAHLWGAGLRHLDSGRGHVGPRSVRRADRARSARAIHLNDSRSPLGSRGDRHEHVGAGRIGAAGLAAFLRDPRLPGRTALVMETPGVDEGFDAINMRRSWLLYGGAETLPILPPRAFRTSRASTQEIALGAVAVAVAVGVGEVGLGTVGVVSQSAAPQRDVGLHQAANIGL